MEDEMTKREREIEVTIQKQVNGEVWKNNEVRMDFQKYT